MSGGPFALIVQRPGIGFDSFIKFSLSRFAYNSFLRNLVVVLLPPRCQLKRFVSGGPFALLPNTQGLDLIDYFYFL